MVSFVLMCCLGQNQESQCLGDTLSKERTVNEERRPPAAHGSRAEENRRNIGPSLLPYQRRSHSRPSRRKRAKRRGPNRKETPTMTLSRTDFAKTAGISRVAGLPNSLIGGRVAWAKMLNQQPASEHFVLVRHF